MTPVYESHRDFYQVLGLTPTTATNEQVVRQAYLKCARKAHPDRDRTNQAATGNFQDIQEAYETLKDLAKKSKYDKSRQEHIRREDSKKREEKRAESRRKEDEAAWSRARNARRTGPAGFGQFGQEKYFPYDRRAPKPAPTSKPPPGASTAWEEMNRARASGKFGQSSQKPASNPPPPRPGPHPTSKTPKKPASQRQGSFAQWAKEHPSSPETPNKNGYRPSSSSMGDEPRAKTNSYQSARKADPISSHDSWESDSDNIESVLKSRPSQPYQKVYRERTRLFEEQTKSSGEDSSGRKKATATGTPNKNKQPAGPQPFWPHPESTSESTGTAQSQSANNPPPPPPPPFDQKPTESPGPWFTGDAPPGGAFTFTAGSETSNDPPPVKKTRSSGHLGRKNTASPTKRWRPDAKETETSAKPPTPGGESPSFKFNAKEWTESFGPQNFIPRATQPSPVSPTRQTRSPLKRSATTGSSSNTPRATTVTDDTSPDEGGGAGLKGDPPRAAAGAAHAPSPNAMDIDSPPIKPSAAPAPTPTRTASARTARTRAVPVEPTNPDWRAGTGQGQGKEASKRTSAPPPLKPTTGGSEDTDEFRAAMGDLKNVPPFAPQGGGLGSFGDLRSSLPFSSQPSESIPRKEPAYKELGVPEPPTPPQFPIVDGIRLNGETVRLYIGSFESYLAQWDKWNGILVGHFQERQKGYAGAAGRLGENLGAAMRGARARIGEASQDRDVRRRWAAACEQHERNLQAYLAMLEKMKPA